MTSTEQTYLRDVRLFCNYYYHFFVYFFCRETGSLNYIITEKVQIIYFILCLRQLRSLNWNLVTNIPVEYYSSLVPPLLWQHTVKRCSVHRTLAMTPHHSNFNTYKTYSVFNQPSIKKKIRSQNLIILRSSFSPKLNPGASIVWNNLLVFSCIYLWMTIIQTFSIDLTTYDVRETNRVISIRSYTCFSIR